MTASAAASAEIVSRSVRIDGTLRIHYRLAGDSGPVMLLIHGYPETSLAWRRTIAPLTAAGLRLVMPDLRGAGGSSRALGSYDKRTLASDIASVLDDAGVDEPVNVVGHDIGSMVAYAFARRFPQRTARLAILDAPLPGTPAIEDVWREGKRAWHFHFHQAIDMPEALTAGREALYLDRFYRDFAHSPDAIDADTRAAYLRDFSQPGAMRAGFDLYRSFTQDADDNRAALARDGRLKMPVLAVAGECGSYAGIVGPMMRELAERVTEVTIANAGHWLAEENPLALCEALIAFAEVAP